MQENINIPDSTITTNLSFRQLVLMNIQQLTNFPYIEKDFDALTDYELLCLVVKFLNDVIANQNEQNDSITRMYQSFLALQDYVNNTKDTLEDAFNSLDDYVRNYFANLDVQEEINNKLDQMLEDGVLEQIIEQFLQLASLLCFDTVANMKNSTNLINGSYAETLGFYEKNDGGSSLYKIRNITNDDVIDNITIIPLNDEENNLIAELITKDSINPEQFGCYGDNIHDDTTNLQILFNYAYSKKLKVILNKKYKITENININRGINISGSTLNAGIYGSNNTIYIKGGTSTSSYANNSDLMLIESVYFYQISFVLGDTTNDFGCGITFNKCVFYGNSQNTSAIIAKNNTWIFTINDCKIGNYSNGIYFKFKNDDNSYVVNSGAAIKITNTDIFNCSYGIYVKGSAADGYNILINNCDIEHDDYSIYTEDGRGNNIQCNNLHIEGNRYGSIYADATNVYVNNIWDFNSNPETYIALYNVVNNGRIVINSGRISYTDYKLANIINGNIYLNTNQIVVTPFCQAYRVLTTTSTKSLLLPSNYQYYVPSSISAKTYNTSSNEATLTTVPKQANHGIRITLDLRQTDATADSNAKRLAVFLNAGSSHGISCALEKYNSFIRLIIEYTNHKLMCHCIQKVDNGNTIDTLYEQYFTDDTTSVNKYIVLNYNAENGKVETIGSKFEYISDFLVS